MTGKILQGDSKLKLGIFGYLHNGGTTLTKAPERWQAKWDDIVTMARIADRGGIDFLMPYARWKGVPGDVSQRESSFETLTHAAALAGHTDRIGLISTVHTPIIHPVIAAKMMTTIDHASHGRAGLNIVCGWNQADFDMFGIDVLEHDERYVHGFEWYEIWSKMTAGCTEPFDFSGKHFPSVKNATALPGSVQEPLPLVISAAFSPAGRAFAIKTSDYLFTNTASIESGRAEIEQLHEMAQSMGRQTPIRTIGPVHIVCRETRAEAEEFFEYYAVEQEDKAAVDSWMSTRKTSAMLPEEIYQMRSRIAGCNSHFPLVGTPADVAEQLIEFQKAGFDAVGIGLFDFARDVVDVVDKIMPILVKAGVHQGAA